MDNYKLISFEKIPSTQDYAHDLIAKKLAENKTIVVAQSQTSGRGRYKRKWVSHSGNLYASFIYKISDRDPKLSYAIGVAIAETLISFGIEPRIKWPNDVLVDGKKISGTLIEYSQNFVIVGIGINIKTCPKLDEYKTEKMHSFNKNISVNDVLSVLIKKIDKWRRANFESVRERWLDLAMCLNKTVKYQGKPAVLIGLNNDGALILRSGSKYFLTYGDEINI